MSPVRSLAVLSLVAAVTAACDRAPTEPSLRPAAAAVARRGQAEPGDDRGGKNTEVGDDHGGVLNTQAGDDKGGTKGGHGADDPVGHR